MLINVWRCTTYKICKLSVLCNMILVLSVGLGTLTQGASACFFWLNQVKKGGAGDLPNIHLSLHNYLTLVVDITRSENVSKPNSFQVKLFIP